MQLVVLAQRCFIEVVAFEAGTHRALQHNSLRLHAVEYVLRCIRSGWWYSVLGLQRFHRLCDV